MQFFLLDLYEMNNHIFFPLKGSYHKVAAGKVT